MDSNMNDKLKKILSGIGSDKLKNSADMVKEFMKTPEGQKLKNSLSDSDKKAILEKFMKLDPKKASDSLKNADLSNLSGMSVDEIMKKLKSEGCMWRRC